MKAESQVYEHFCNQKIPREHRRKAETLAKKWIIQYGDSLGIPTFKLNKLMCDPDESVILALDQSWDHREIAIDSVERVTQSKISFKGTSYSIFNIYINERSLQNQTIYFEFSQEGQLTSVIIFEDDKKIFSKFISGYAFRN